MDRSLRAGVAVIATSKWAGNLSWIATGPVTRGATFPVVWICAPDEWEAAQSEERDPAAVPWPADDVAIDLQRAGSMTHGHS